MSGERYQQHKEATEWAQNFHNNNTANQHTNFQWCLPRVLVNGMNGGWEDIPAGGRTFFIGGRGEVEVRKFEKSKIHSIQLEASRVKLIVSVLLNWYRKVIVNLVLNRVNITITLIQIFFHCESSLTRAKHNILPIVESRGSNDGEPSEGNHEMMGISLSVNLYNPFQWASPLPPLQYSRVDWQRGWLHSTPNVAVAEYMLR